MLLDILIRLALHMLAVQAAVTGRDDDEPCDEQTLVLDAPGVLLEPRAASTLWPNSTTTGSTPRTPLAFNPIGPARMTTVKTSLTSTSTSSKASSVKTSLTSTSTSSKASSAKTSLTSTSTSSKASSTKSSSSPFGPSRTSSSVSVTSSSVSSARSSSALSSTSPASSSASVTSISSSASSTPTTSSKLVFAHHIVGYTYSYTVSDWTNDISLAASKGIDAFALNVGSDAWEPGQVANAFQAAKNLGTSFKLFLSFDMTSIACAGTSDAQLLRDYITTYASHPNQLLYNGAVFISGFSGDACTFGAGSVNQGWINAIKTGLPAVYFVPAFFDTQNFAGWSVLDGAFAWNSGWPMQDTDISFDQDQTYISALGGRTYMAAVSPWFFTHYGVNSYNKNFIYRGDDWLLSERWELLMQNRDAVQFVEIATWNDYSESHYVGPIDGSQPNSQSWVDGFDHQGWLDLIAYYSAAFKTGSYPAITRDRTFLWARLYPAAASSPDPVPKPTNWQWTEDYLWAVVQLTTPATVTLTCGSASSTTSVAAGTTKLKLAFPSENCTVTSAISRDGSVSTFAPANFNYQLSPPSYNFNAFVAASP